MLNIAYIAELPAELHGISAACLRLLLQQMQVNRSPSFGTDEQLDYDIKSAVIEDAVRMLNIKYACLFICNHRHHFASKAGLPVLLFPFLYFLPTT